MRLGCRARTEPACDVPQFMHHHGLREHDHAAADAESAHHDQGVPEAEFEQQSVGDRKTSRQDGEDAGDQESDYHPIIPRLRQQARKPFHHDTVMFRLGPPAICRDRFQKRRSIRRLFTHPSASHD
jgi:hypothetical protein